MDQRLQCPDCGKYLHLKEGRHGLFWGCEAFETTGCKGSVGAFSDGRPLGIPASKEVRALRAQVHYCFDQIWSGKSAKIKMKRNNAYKWLAREMNLTEHTCHIGQFDKSQCQEALGILRKYSDYLGLNMPEDIWKTINTFTES